MVEIILSEIGFQDGVQVCNAIYIHRTTYVVRISPNYKPL